MIRAVEITKDYRCFRVGECFELRALTLLVGDQGTGKSTLLSLLRDEGTGRGKGFAKLTCEPSPMLWFDFEKDNPRAHSTVGNTEASFRSLFLSHGQMVRGMLQALGERLPSVVLMDEPDVALSARTALWLRGYLGELVDGGHQIIAAVHNPLVFEDRWVLSLEHRRWMSGDEFLETQREER